MTLKGAASLALVGTLILTTLLAVDFLTAAIGVLRDVTPALALFRSLIYLLASLSLTIFLFVFQKAQSR